MDPATPSEQALIEAGCRMLSITAEPAWMDVIAFNLRVIGAQAATLLAPPLPDGVDPAPVFTA